MALPTPTPEYVAGRRAYLLKLLGREPNVIERTDFDLLYQKGRPITMESLYEREMKARAVRAKENAPAVMEPVIPAVEPAWVQSPVINNGRPVENQSSNRAAITTSGEASALGTLKERLANEGIDNVRKMLNPNYQPPGKIEQGLDELKTQALRTNPKDREGPMGVVASLLPTATNIRTEGSGTLKPGYESPIWYALRLLNIPSAVLGAGIETSYETLAGTGEKSGKIAEAESNLARTLSGAEGLAEVAEKTGKIGENKWTEVTGLPAQKYIDLPDIPVLDGKVIHTPDFQVIDPSDMAWWVGMGLDILTPSTAEVFVKGGKGLKAGYESVKAGTALADIEAVAAKATDFGRPNPKGYFGPRTQRTPAPPDQGKALDPTIEKPAPPPHDPVVPDADEARKAFEQRVEHVYSTPVAQPIPGMERELAGVPVTIYDNVEWHTARQAGRVSTDAADTVLKGRVGVVPDGTDISKITPGDLQTAGFRGIVKVNKKLDRLPDGSDFGDTVGRLWEQVDGVLAQTKVLTRLQAASPEYAGLARATAEAGAALERASTKLTRIEELVGDFSNDALALRSQKAQATADLEKVENSLKDIVEKWQDADSEFRVNKGELNRIDKEIKQLKIDIQRRNTFVQSNPLKPGHQDRELEKLLHEHAALLVKRNPLRQLRLKALDLHLQLVRLVRRQKARTEALATVVNQVEHAENVVRTVQDKLPKLGNDVDVARMHVEDLAEGQTRLDQIKNDFREMEERAFKQGITRDVTSRVAENAAHSAVIQARAIDAHKVDIFGRGEKVPTTKADNVVPALLKELRNEYTSRLQSIPDRFKFWLRGKDKPQALDKAFSEVLPPSPDGKGFYLDEVPGQVEHELEYHGGDGKMHRKSSAPVGVIRGSAVYSLIERAFIDPGIERGFPEAVNATTDDLLNQVRGILADRFNTDDFLRQLVEAPTQNPATTLHQIYEHLLSVPVKLESGTQVKLNKTTWEEIAAQLYFDAASEHVALIMLDKLKTNKLVAFSSKDIALLEKLGAQPGENGTWRHLTDLITPTGDYGYQAIAQEIAGHTNIEVVQHYYQVMLDNDFLVPAMTVMRQGASDIGTRHALVSAMGTTTARQHLAAELANHPSFKKGDMMGIDLPKIVQEQRGKNFVDEWAEEMGAGIKSEDVLLLRMLKAVLWHHPTFLKSSMLGGSVLPNIRYQMMNFLTQPLIIAQQLGGRTALGALVNLPTGVDIMAHIDAPEAFGLPPGWAVKPGPGVARGYTYKDIRDLVLNLNISSGQAKVETQAPFIKDMVRYVSQPNWKRRLSPSTYLGFTQTNIWNQIANDVDAAGRVGVLVDSLRAGDSEELALRKARESLFDYNKPKSEIEKQFFARYAFFYNFMRENFISTLRNAKTTKGQTRIKNQLKLTYQSLEPNEGTSDGSDTRIRLGKTSRDLPDSFALYGPGIPMAEALSQMADVTAATYWMLGEGNNWQGVKPVADDLANVLVNPYLDTLVKMRTYFSLRDNRPVTRPDPRIVEFWRLVPGMLDESNPGAPTGWAVQLFDLVPDADVPGQEGRYKFGDKGKGNFITWQNFMYDLIGGQGKTTRDYTYLFNPVAGKSQDDPRVNSLLNLSTFLGINTPLRTQTIKDANAIRTRELEQRYGQPN